MNFASVLTAAGVVVALLVVVGLALVFRDPGAARRRIESLFRRPEKPARIAGREQYYRPYWSR